MLVLLLALLVLLAIALAIALAIVLGRRRAPVYALPPPAANWLAPIGEDSGALSEVQRCDLIFAVAALEDATSETLLSRALDDPSEGVALAAAHALVRRGGLETLERHLARCSSERARSLRLLVEILD